MSAPSTLEEEFDQLKEIAKREGLSIGEYLKREAERLKNENNRKRNS